MTTAATHVFLWDIDGTLLSTGRAGLKAWEDASRDVLGYDRDLTTIRMSGLTDPMIAREIVIASGRRPDPVVEARLTQAYTDGLPACLTPVRGGVLPGVVDVLDDLAARPDVLLALLTGNMRAGARAKLACYGLAHYFDRAFDVGAFGDDGFERPQIGRVAMQRAAEVVGDLALDRVYLVGDSPYDVACARALGIRMIAVATGDHTIGDLDVGDPWWVLDRLPSAADFCQRLSLVLGDGAEARRG